nr:hypothetical protein [Micromonospora sp. DSM 115978]
MATDKRELLLVIKGRDDGGRKALKDVGDAADDTREDIDEMSVGLRKLDDKVKATTTTLVELRKEINRTGDLDLLKDVTKQEQRLKALERQRRALLGPDGIKGVTGGQPDPEVEGRSLGARLGAGVVTGLKGALSARTGLIGSVVSAVGSGITPAVLLAAVAPAVAGGVALAAQDSRVQTAAKGLWSEVLGNLTDAAAPFIPAVLNGLDVIRDEFALMDADLRGIFDAGANYVEPIVKGITGLVRNTLPGLRKAVEASGPVVDALARELPKIGTALGDLFAESAQYADEAAAVITFALRTVAGAIELTSKVAGAAMDTWRFLGFKDAEDGADRAAESTGRWRVELGLLGKTDPGIDELWQRQVLLNKSMSEGIKQAGGLKEALDLLNGATLSAREAERAWQKSIDDVTASIKENGKSLDVTTEKGRANQETLDALATSGANRAQSIYEQTLATKGQVAAEEAAIRAYEQGRAQLIKSAMQMGLSKQQARALADQIMAIPREWRTQVKADTGPARRSVKSYKDWLASQNLDKRSRIILEQQSARGGFKQYSKGGPVFGAAKGRDTVPAMLGHGEHVFTAQEVDAAGGHGAIERLRESLRAGSPAMGGGGGGAMGGGGGGAQVIELRVGGAASGIERLFLSWLQGALRGNPGVKLRTT